MPVVNVHAAKTHLSRLIERALVGEEIVIARGSTPVVKLVPLDQPQPHREFGALKGKLHVSDKFLEPLESDELASWGE